VCQSLYIGSHAIDYAIGIVSAVLYSLLDSILLTGVVYFLVAEQQISKQVSAIGYYLRIRGTLTIQPPSFFPGAAGREAARASARPGQPRVPEHQGGDRAEG
jgi:hypothetical protein